MARSQNFRARKRIEPVLDRGEVGENAGRLGAGFERRVVGVKDRHHTEQILAVLLIAHCHVRFSGQMITC